MQRLQRLQKASLEKLERLDAPNYSGIPACFRFLLIGASFAQAYGPVALLNRRLPCHCHLAAQIC